MEVSILIRRSDRWLPGKRGGGGRAQRGKWCTHNMTNKNVQPKSHKVVIYHNINKKKKKVHGCITIFKKIGGGEALFSQLIM